jgi:hypothetical protein
MELPIYDLNDPELDLMTEIQHNLPAEELDAAIADLSPEARRILHQHCLLCAERQADIIARIDNILSQPTK